MERIFEYLKKQPPGRIIALGFASVILLGALLLMLPVSVQEGHEVSPINALFTSTSAVCVTGLVVVDTGDTFSLFGRWVVAMLIQIGGLGVASVGATFILAAGKRVGMKGRKLIKESLNVDSYEGMVRLIHSILAITIVIEGLGAALSFIVFIQDYPFWKAVELSLFHSIAAFNNAGFDIFGGMQSMIPYRDDVLLNLTTCALVFFGGLGFLVIVDIRRNCCFKKLTLHSKVVLTTSIALTVFGTLLLRATEDITWLGAFFHSVIARTAGFCTYSMDEFTNAGLFILSLLMFIGASPGSTGGGIKTSTFFTLFLSVKTLLTKKAMGAFHRNVSQESLSKAYTITLLSVLVVCVGIFSLCILEKDSAFMDIMFEVISAFGTVGLSVGMTPDLHCLSKLILISIMFIGRIGAFTIISMWVSRPAPTARYTEENITIG